MKFMDIDGPLMQFLGKMADLMWLNILTIICCIPVFTAGAALTALHYMALKIVRDEEGYITRSYFKSFKENFKQSTLIWLIFLVIFGVLAVDYRIMVISDVEINRVVSILIIVFSVLSLLTFMFVFPVQARFVNPVKVTIWNSFLFGVVQFPKTVVMVVFYALPYVLGYYFPQILPIVLVFGLSLPAYLSAQLYNKFFLRMEEQILMREADEADEDGDAEGAGDGEDSADEDERIFKDELDESIESGQND